MSSDFVTRTELDDLLVQQRRKIERLEQQAAETRESIVSFRQWSIIVGSRVSQCETWIVGLMPTEQRACVTGDVVSAPTDGELVERAGVDLKTLEPTAMVDDALQHKWKVGDRCFVVRCRRDVSLLTVSLHFFYELDDAESFVEGIAADVVAGRSDLGFVCVNVATVTRVDVLANEVMLVGDECELRREDEEPTPATPKTGSLVARPGEAWIV